MNKKIKKMMATMMIATALGTGTAFATPTNTNSVVPKQQLMNLSDNPNYVLIYSNVGIGYYLDVTSITIKQDDDKGRYWAQNVIPVNQKTGQWSNPITQFYYYDRKDETASATKMYDTSRKEWEVIEPFDPRSTVQLECRGYYLGYLFAFQKGNPEES